MTEHRQKPYITKSCLCLFGRSQDHGANSNIFRMSWVEDSQDANGIFEAIKKAFEKCDLLALTDKL